VEEADEAAPTQLVVGTDVAALLRHTGPDCLEIEITGELDGPGLERLSTAVPLTPSSRVVVDLSGVTFMGSGAISWLVSLRRRIDQLLVRNPSSIVLRVLEITGLADLLAIVDPPAPNDRTD
jgi:anti-anti-sigma factor